MSQNDSKSVTSFNLGNEICDPSLRYGGEIIFNNEVPIEFRSDETKQSEMIILRIKIIEVKEDDQLSLLIIELTSESDIFFLFELTFNNEDFNKFKKEQKMNTSFEEFPHILIEILTEAAKQTEVYSINFTLMEDHGSLNVQQILKFKTVDIFSLGFVPSPDEYVRDQIQYRYNTVRIAANTSRAELSNLYSMLKIKNPGVFKQMKHRSSK